MARESAAQAALRWKMHALVQEQYSDPHLFLDDAMDVLGFKTTWLQHDIMDYLLEPYDNMVQAGRGEAKSTVCCIAVVWGLIQDPKHRFVIFSASAAKALENSTLIVRLLGGMPELKHMLPDTQNGDRSSVENFDLHYTLKGISASPSVKCLGLGSARTGFRADTIAMDDLEIPSNSQTQAQRDKILAAINEMPSICDGRPQDGVPPRLRFLGTPQSRDSVYNTLPAKGIQVRIWPHRYPTDAQIKDYQGLLAPSLLRRLEENPGLATGGGVLKDQGQPTDPQLKPERALRAIEERQGIPVFRLQHMLNTALTDAARYPLKTEGLVLVTGATATRVPVHITRGLTPQTLVSHSVGSAAWRLQTPSDVALESEDASATVTAYVDPAAGGANGDETAYSVGVAVNGNVWLLTTGAVPGGYGLDTLKELAQRLVRAGVRVCVVEKNMGYGAFREVFQPVLSQACRDAGMPVPGFVDDQVSGQKERRIINILAPVIGRGALVVAQEALDQDRRDCEAYPPHQATSMSLWHQIAQLTDAKDSLRHDDRVDALAGLVGQFVSQLAAKDDERFTAQSEEARKQGIQMQLGWRPKAFDINRARTPGPRRR